MFPAFAPNEDSYVTPLWTDAVAREAMEGYLVWEVALVPQYDRDPLVEFSLA